MSNVYSLDDLKADLEREFAPVVIDLGSGKVTLRNIMRLGHKARAAVQEALKDVTREKGEEFDEESSLEAIKTIVRLVADTQGDELCEQIGEDTVLASRIANLWMEATQPGEAQSSPA